MSELSNSVGGAFTVLFSIVTTIGLVRILNQTAGGRYDTSSVLEVVAFSSLTNLPPLIALALFLGVLLTLMRYWQNNEMVVWFSSGGLSLMSWIRPVLRFSVPVLVLVALSSVVLSPWSRSELTAYKDRFAAKEDVSKLSPGRFIEAEGGNRVFFLEKIDQQSGKVDNVFIVQKGAGGKESVVISQKGRVEMQPNGDKYIVLHDGTRYSVFNGKSEMQVSEFKTYKMRVDSSPIMPTEISRMNSLPISLLLAKRDALAARAEIFWRISWPLIALNLVLLAIPLSYNNPRVGRSFGLIGAVLIFILYLNSLSILQTWITQGRVGFWTAIAGMNAAVAALTAVLFYRLMAMNSWKVGSSVWNALCYPLRKIKSRSEKKA
jgi:lipopolysaccharide export system permease protein